MKIKLSDIQQKSKIRPAGYYEDVVSSGAIVDDYLEITPEEIERLRIKYSSIEVFSSPAPPPQMPSLFQQAKNFGTAVAKHALNGMEEASLPIYEERLNKCMGCPLLNNADAENPRCTKCGCYVKIKARWASESCPDTPKKWEAIPTQKNGGCGGCGGN